jgi:CheY-like chemotaxis protein
MLVEDNIVNQKVAGMMLRKMGYVIEVASNGREAVEKVEKAQFDLILMDIQMPVMDGIEATGRIRAMDHLKYQPRIIALTAHAMNDDVTQCLKNGMNGHLAKPLRAALLKNAIINAYNDIRLKHHV